MFISIVFCVRFVTKIAEKTVTDVNSLHYPPCFSHRNIVPRDSETLFCLCALGTGPGLSDLESRLCVSKCAFRMELAF